MTVYYFVQPTDSLFIRGNLAFGDSGEHGTSTMPPLPSLFAGAFRSALLGREVDALTAFTQNGRSGDDRLDKVLGTYNSEGKVLSHGSFRMSWLSLAGEAVLTPGPSPAGRGGTQVEAIFPLPADLVALEDDHEKGVIRLASITPGRPSDLTAANSLLPLTALLRSPKQAKPQGGYYLRQAGFIRHRNGDNLVDLNAVQTGHAIPMRQLHSRDPRLGIGLNSDSRTAESGLIYTTEGYAFGSGDRESPFAATGFLVGVDGVDDLIPETGFLRLGGDGRSARYQRVDFRPPAASFGTLNETSGFRLILQTPGLFADGWLPDGIKRGESGQYRWEGDGFSARLVCAAVPRRDVVSGWDLFNWKPKNAERVAPAGSVYWFDEFQGDPGKLAASVSSGLPCHNRVRRTEGFNLAILGFWHEGGENLCKP